MKTADEHDDVLVVKRRLKPSQGEQRVRHRGRRTIVGLVAAVLVLVGAGAGGLYFLTDNIGNNVARVPDVFGPLAGTARPADQGALTFLLVGTDSRASDPTTGSDGGAAANPGSQRSDVRMLSELSLSRTGAAVISLPRDSWVDIPGHGKNKISTAYTVGGASLLVQTVEQLTGVRVDHFALMDFAGFQRMVDAVGGIDVNVAAATSDRGVDFQRGVNHLDGADALVYVRQRLGLANGDLDRAQREQNALRALLSKAASSSSVTEPLNLYQLLDATSRAVSVDDTLSNDGFRHLAISTLGLRLSSVTFVNAPVSSVGREGAQHVDYLDAARSAELWTAERDGTISDYAARHPADRLSSTPS